FLRILIAAFLVALFSTNTLAHTALQESNPGDGATVKTPPVQLDLVFNGPVKLIKLELMGVGHEMPTKFEPLADAVATYRIETPGMHPGQFTVNWAVIGADGHTVANSFSFVVDPAAEEHTGHGADHGHEDHDDHTGNTEHSDH
ncbi:MAG: copper resistance CopC family protein, partial [Pseudomonadota bacterium]|nr:copper resistance CopC family protein [Pseudomonadota bacterium]